MDKPQETQFNMAQKEAITHTDGPLLILAGAGSGKTKVLTHRIIQLIQNGVPPHHILAVTFTNKAADEMKHRISALTKNIPLASEPWIGTFHALGGFILHKTAKHGGRTANFSIFDEEDSLALLKESMKELAIDPKQFQPGRVRAIISQKKGDLVGQETFRKEAEGHYYPQIIARIWELYEQKLAGQKAFDFDDLLLKPVEIFRAHPEILRAFQKQWRYIHIDEYQDTNHAQYVLTNLLAQAHKNICVVGDPDQCVYSWRGADFRNILAFENDWPGTRLVTLEENYRSTQVILDAANAVIVKNKQRKPKYLFTQKKEGENISFFAAQNEQEEARVITEKIKELESHGIPLRECAILLRTNFQSRALEETFLRAGIPYRITGVKFFNRKEIKDVLAYIRAALNENDCINVKRIINIPPRGIGKTLALKIIGKSKLKGQEKKKLDEFNLLLRDIRTVAETKRPSEALKIVLTKTGYWNLWDPETEEGEMRIANLKELVTLATRYDAAPPSEGMRRLLTEAALMSEQDTLRQDKNAVNIMTAHAAKGLEFDNVFVAGLEDGLFPHTTIAGEDDADKQEEERRLFYVALTRARKKLFLSFALTRTIFGEKRINMPSRFLSDIPGHLIEPIEKNNTLIDYGL